LFALWILLLLCLVPVFAGAAEILAARAWPAREYTRVTIESKEVIRFELQSISNPPRVVVDLTDIALTRSLADLATRIEASDPHISQVRFGRHGPQTTRVVFDLKQEALPKAFLIEPVGQYRHRLVIDLYPAHQVDPIAGLLSELDRPKPQADSATPVDTGVDVAKKKQKPGIASKKPDRLITVAIDAGHGGEDPGATGQSGTNEKQITLAIARILKARIDNEPNMRAVLIRDGDYFIPLAERVARARRLRSDLFVSVHADAFIKTTARGSSVFALSEKGASSAAARWLAKRENAADLIGGVDLGTTDSRVKQVLFDLSQTATLNDSLKLARAVLKEIGSIGTLHKSAVEQASFAVLKAPDIPSILVETAFITNPEEEERLKSESYQREIAEAILAGIKRYFTANPPAPKSTRVATAS
jgi:N-acetylmuramoyl-L-alanine amidase